MTKQSKNTIKNWFKNGAFPNQFHFWDWMDSFFHKDEQIPASQIDQLQDLLDAKVDRKDLPDGEMAMDDISGLNSALDTKVDKEDGKGLSTEDFSLELKTKLDGLEEGANKYEHPLTHPANMIEETADKAFISEAEKLANANHITNNDLHKTSEQIRSEIVDENIPASIARSIDLDTKVSKEAGKGLSTEDFSSELKIKLEGLEEGTEKLYTDTRARAAISASGSLTYNQTSGVFSYTAPTLISTFTNDSNYITSSYTGFVKTTGAEIVAGEKTFSDAIVKPTQSASTTVDIIKRDTSIIQSITDADSNVSWNLLGAKMTSTGLKGSSIAIGLNACNNTTFASWATSANVFIGESAGADSKEPSSCVSVGKNAGSKITGASASVTSIGYDAGANSASASNSTFVGYGAGGSGSNKSRNNCVMVGGQAGLFAHSTGSVLLGYRAGTNIYQNYVVAIGDNACGQTYSSTDTTNSISIGGRANYGLSQSVDITNSIAIGYGVKNEYINQILIGNSSHTEFKTPAPFNTLSGYQLNGVRVPLSHFTNDLLGTTTGKMPEVGTDLVANQSVYTDSNGKLISKAVSQSTAIVNSVATLTAALTAKMPNILFSSNISLTADITKDFTGIDIDLRGYSLILGNHKLIHSSTTIFNNVTIRNGTIITNQGITNKLILQLIASKWTTVNLIDIIIISACANSDTEYSNPHIESTVSKESLKINIRNSRMTSTLQARKPFFVIKNSASIQSLTVTMSGNEAHDNSQSSSVHKVVLRGNDPTVMANLIHDDSWDFHPEVSGSLTNVAEFNFGGKPAKKIFEFADSNSWVVTHNRRCYPNALILDSSGNKMLSDINYADENTFTVSHVNNQTGKVIIQ